MDTLQIIQAVKERREKVGWTRAALARKAGVSKEMVCKMEAGKANPGLRTISQILNALDMELIVKERTNHEPEQKD